MHRDFGWNALLERDGDFCRTSPFFEGRWNLCLAKLGSQKWYTLRMKFYLKCCCTLLLLAAAENVMRASLLYATFVSAAGAPSVNLFTPSLGPISSVSIPVSPTGLAASVSGDFYIASANSTYEFDASGTLLHTITGSPTTLTPGLSFDGTNVLAGVTDGGFNAVATFSSTLGFISQVTTAGPVEGVAWGSGGNFYISSGNSTYEYDSAGTLLHSITASPTTDTPRAAFNGSNVFVDVIDGGFNAIAIFSPTLGFVTQFSIAGPPAGLAVDSAGDIYVSSSNNIYELNSSGTLLGSYSAPSGTVIRDLSFVETPEPASFVPTAFGLLVGLAFWRRRGK
jgi:hypothetical protein